VQPGDRLSIHTPGGGGGGLRGGGGGGGGGVAPPPRPQSVACTAPLGVCVLHAQPVGRVLHAVARAGGLRRASALPASVRRMACDRICYRVRLRIGRRIGHLPLSPPSVAGARTAVTAGVCRACVGLSESRPHLQGGCQAARRRRWLDRRCSQHSCTRRGHPRRVHGRTRDGCTDAPVAGASEEGVRVVGRAPNGAGAGRAAAIPLD